MYKVMLVEDDEIIRYVYSKMKSWGEYGFRIAAEAANGTRAIEEMKEHPVDVIFTDIRMPLMDGIELMKQMRKEYPEVLFVFISSYNEFEYAREGLRLGAVDYIVKPMSEENLAEVLSRICELLAEQNKSGMQELMEKILPTPELAKDPLMKKLALYFEENMKRNLTIEEVAEALAMNKDYMGRQIKSKTGLTFRSLYNLIKIEYAKPLIQSGQYKVYEVAELLGYASADHFSQLFKNLVHMTPAEYKKNANI